MSSNNMNYNTNNDVRGRSKADFKIPESYFTHDNGSTPFKVNISDQTIGIYEYDEEFRSERLIKSTDFTEVFIGEDDSLTDDFSKGNSILVNVADNKYIHIGCEVFEFVTEEPIRTYTSIIGNNDVPYPYATSDSKVYLMLSYITLAGRKCRYWYADKSLCNLSDLYGQFYKATSRFNLSYAPFEEFEVTKLYE